VLTRRKMLLNSVAVVGATLMAPVAIAASIPAGPKIDPYLACPIIRFSDQEMTHVMPFWTFIDEYEWSAEWDTWDRDNCEDAVREHAFRSARLVIDEINASKVI
jgi:hypothetical protein